MEQKEKKARTIGEAATQMAKRMIKDYAYWEGVKREGGAVGKIEPYFLAKHDAVTKQAILRYALEQYEEWAKANGKVVEPSGAKVV